MRHRLHLSEWVACLGLALTLGLGCATGPSVTPAEIDRAEAAGDLESLHRRLQEERSGLSSSSLRARSLDEALAQTGARLGEGREREIRGALAGATLLSGLVPIAALDAGSQQLAPVKGWDPARYETLAAELAALRGETEQAIERKQGELAGLGPDAEVRHLEILGELEALAGTGSPAGNAYRERRDERLAALQGVAQQAIAQENYDEAQRVLRVVRNVDPSAAGVAETLVDVDAKLFEQKFWQALEQGDSDRAYDLFRSLATSDEFPPMRARLGDSADTMASIFVEQAASATRAGRLGNAYRWFAQARDIRGWLGQANPAPPAEEGAFLDRVRRRYDRALADGQVELAWGHLRVMQELDPGQPSLRRMLRETRDRVLDRAVKRLTAADFEDSSGQSEFGRAVASKVIQYIFERIPNDVRIVEREELSDVLREKELGGAGEKLASADYLIQGSILEAKVDTTQEKGRRTERVVTEHETIANPKHTWWMGLSEKERSRTDEPPETITVPRKEDVTIEITVHRKVGLFSVSYRVIEAQSAKVVFADSTRASAQHDDTSSEGIQLGDFKQEFKLAALPSDVEILATLADEISAEIGAKLAEVFQNPEASYASQARRYADEGNYRDAARAFAYAVALAERKEQDVPELRRDLQRIALAADL